MNAARLFITVLAIIFSAQAHAANLAFGPSARRDSFDIALRAGGHVAPEIEFEFLSEGKQPDGIPNINRVLMLNTIFTRHIAPRLIVFAKVGVNTSRFSTNGSGNGYHNPGRAGVDLGAGFTYWLTKHLGLRLQTTWMRTEQSDVPQFERFVLTSVQIVVPLA